MKILYDRATKSKSHVRHYFAVPARRKIILATFTVRP